MYLIGINDFDFIKITHQSTMCDGKHIWNEVRNLEYETPLHEATIIPNYESAEKLLKEIQDNVEKIKVSNNNIIGEILDKDNGFDKTKYVKELKIYELIPTLVDKDGE